MKQKTNKLRKLEQNRYSIIASELDCCWFCGRTPVELHEIYAGANRKNSMKNGFVVPLCSWHHKIVQMGGTLDIGLKKLCQQQYEKTHSREDWLKIIRKNYL